GRPRAACSSRCRVRRGRRSRRSSRARSCSSHASAGWRPARAWRSRDPDTLGRMSSVGAQSVRRARSFALSAPAFRRLTLASAVMLVLIVASGATVRLTGSGLGCEHWPGCEPHHFEPRSVHSYIEVGNRVVAFFTILATLATFVGSLAAKTSTAVRVTAFVIFLGTLAQAPLGAITIHYHLNPWLVLSHFLLSVVVLTLAVALAVEVRP